MLASTQGAKLIEFPPHGVTLGVDLTLEFCHRLPLAFALHRIALDQHFEVHPMSVELRTIQAGEFALAIDRNATASAHAGSVDHDRVQAEDGSNLLFGLCPARCFLGEED